MRDACREILCEAKRFFDDSPWRKGCSAEIERLLVQVDEPCVLAVAGRIKAGKSTMINALLGEDLARVGVTETTATINYFRYGTPKDASRPVLCRWRDGRTTWETRDFLDSLQGHDGATLLRANEVDCLEFYLPNPDLREVTLVDTPGTDALVSEHNEAAEQFFGTRDRDIAKQLGERHLEETKKLTQTADAVIYLVGQVAHVTNRDFLQEFQQSSSGYTKALNALGVMSQIDKQDDILNQRDELARAIGEKLKEELNTVLPVSAGLWLALKKLRQEGRLESLQQVISSIPPERFDLMMSSDRAYERDYPDCPVDIGTRKALRSGMPWRVFVVITRVLRKQPLDAAILELDRISGFPVLQKTVRDHFFERSQLLRCHRIMMDLNGLMDGIRRSGLHVYRDGLAQQKNDFEDFTDFIISHPKGTGDVANRLRRYLSDHIPKDRADEMESSLGVLAQKVEFALLGMYATNRNFDGLRLLNDAPSGTFTDDELSELHRIFGLFAQDGQEALAASKQLLTKQMFWRNVKIHSRNAKRAAVAQLAEEAYGRLLQKTGHTMF